MDLFEFDDSNDGLFSASCRAASVTTSALRKMGILGVPNRNRPRNQDSSAFESRWFLFPELDHNGL